MALPHVPALHSSPDYPAWQRAYELALLETDLKVLVERVEVAEAEILTRRDVLGCGLRGAPELQAIEDALANLRVLKKESLPCTDAVK